MKLESFEISDLSNGLYHKMGDAISEGYSTGLSRLRFHILMDKKWVILGRFPQPIPSHGTYKTKTITKRQKQAFTSKPEDTMMQN